MDSLAYWKKVAVEPAEIQYHADARFADEATIRITA
jgi:hypothetical protein